LFIRAGYQTSDEQWRQQAEVVNGAETKQKQELGEFDTLYECRTVSMFFRLLSAAKYSNHTMS